MKRILALVLAAVLLLGMTGCQSGKSKNAYSDFDGISVRVKRVMENEDTIKLVIIWENETEYDAIYGSSYDIERLENGQWVSCAKQTLMFDAIGYGLDAGSKQSETYNLTELFDVSAPGTYRFQTECYVSTNAEQNQKCQLWAEFSLGAENNENTEVALKYNAQYIRTNGYHEGAQFPKVSVIRSLQELNAYYTANREVYDLERKKKVYSDTTIGFLDACDRYDEAFFEENFLIMVLLEEGSGSIRHKVQDVEQTMDKRIRISIERKVPGVCTDDMAQWHILLELSREAEVETSDAVQVYLDGKLTWSEGAVVPTKLDISFVAPPVGTLRTRDGDFPLKAAGYNWTYLNGNGTAVTTVADQTSRPVPAEDLTPVSINREHAESVYAYVPKTGAYALTDGLGFLVKLYFDVMPDSITYQCWSDGTKKLFSAKAESVDFYREDPAFYAKLGAYIYEISATWENDGSGFYGTANYYVYILGGQDHVHKIPEEPQTVADPFVGYCGNTWTRLHIGNKTYAFMYGYSVALTKILNDLDYKPEKVCRCMAEYTVDTEFGTGYRINLTEGFVRCEKGQASLTQEQIDQIAEIVKWAKETNCKYPVNG